MKFLPIALATLLLAGCSGELIYLPTETTPEYRTTERYDWIPFKVGDSASWVVWNWGRADQVTTSGRWHYNTPYGQVLIGFRGNKVSRIIVFR